MATIIPIDDPSDSRIEEYRDIRERDLARRGNLFVAEGKVVLTQMLSAGRYRPKSVLIADHRIGAVADLLAQVPAGVPVYAASQSVFDSIAGFNIHRGILAVAERPVLADADAMLAALPAHAIVLVLCAIANHDNMGGIFRNAAAFGADAVLLDAQCCDPLYRKAIRVSVGAALRVPFTRLARGADICDLLERHAVTPFALSPAGAAALADVRPPARAAIVLGAEGPGLGSDLIARMTGVRIPIAGGFDSLNVATTSGIVLHHFVSCTD